MQGGGGRATSNSFSEYSGGERALNGHLEAPSLSKLAKGKGPQSSVSYPARATVGALRPQSRDFTVVGRGQRPDAKQGDMEGPSVVPELRGVCVNTDQAVATTGIVLTTGAIIPLL